MTSLITNQACYRIACNNWYRHPSPLSPTRILFHVCFHENAKFWHHFFGQITCPSIAHPIYPHPLGTSSPASPYLIHHTPHRCPWSEPHRVICQQLLVTESALVTRGGCWVYWCAPQRFLSLYSGSSLYPVQCNFLLAPLKVLICLINGNDQWKTCEQHKEFGGEFYSLCID